MNESRDVPSTEVRKHLAEHLDRVLAGEEFVISRHGRPSARLAPLTLEENDDDD